jgi:hypothetical protein
MFASYFSPISLHLSNMSSVQLVFYLNWVKSGLYWHDGFASWRYDACDNCSTDITTFWMVRPVLITCHSQCISNTFTFSICLVTCDALRTRTAAIYSPHICSLTSSLIISSAFRTDFQHRLSLEDCRQNFGMHLYFLHLYELHALPIPLSLTWSPKWYIPQTLTSSLYSCLYTGQRSLVCIIVLCNWRENLQSGSE